MMDDRAKDAQKKPITRETQIQQAENFLRSRLESAKQAERPETALSDLGDAIHTAQDASSPAHRGFQNWHTQSGFDHVTAEKQYPGQGTREKTELEGATQWMHDIFTGKTEMPSQFYNPRTGELNLPQQYRIPAAQGQ